MEQLLEFLKPEGVWGTITSVLLLVIFYINKYVSKDKQWRYTKEKSSRDKLCLLFLRILVFNLIYVVISIFIVVLLTQAGFNETTQRIISIVICILLGFVLYLYERKSVKLTIVHIKNESIKKMLESVSVAIPIIMAVVIGILYISDWNWKVYSCIRNVGIFFAVVFIAFAVFLLDGERKYKYKYAEFHFKESDSTINVKIEEIYHSGGWVIVKEINRDSQIRFINKDIKKVIYTTD